MSMADRPRVLIYRRRVLPVSETFIRNHGDALTRYDPVYAGIERVDGVQLAPRPVQYLNATRKSARFERFAFMLGGYGPDFRARLEQVRPALIHAHFALDGYDMIPVARALNAPLVVTFHGNDVARKVSTHFRPRHMVGKLHFLFNRAALNRQAAAFLPVSGFIRDRAIDKGYAPEKCRVHYLGIDLERFHAHAPGGRAHEVLFVGRLVEKKGAPFLIDAMARVQARDPALRLTIIGDGPMRAELERQAAKTLVNYRFMGAVASEQVAEAMTRAKLFCMPSIHTRSGESEGLPTVFMEAQASMLPCVAFDIPPMNEAICNGETGILAPVGDIEALAAAIASLTGDEPKRAAFAAAARAFVERKFNAAAQAEKLEDLYDLIIAEHRRTNGEVTRASGPSAENAFSGGRARS